MNLTAKTPCCGFEKRLTHSSVIGRTLTFDRLCGACGTWWRLDVTCTGHLPEGRGLVHRVGWTHVGKRKA